MGKTFFEDGNIVTKTLGTRVLAAWLNKVFSHRHDGSDQDGSAPLDFAADTGAVNAVVVTMTPPLTALTVGMPLYVQVANNNTGPVTVEVDGFGQHPLHRLGGVDLVAGDLQATQVVIIAWDGVNFQLISYNPQPMTDATTLQGQGAARLSPPGLKGEFFMPTAPAGWLPCDGRLVLRAQYPDLFAEIGTTWGAGDNVTTFALPEVRGEHFRAWDNGRGVDPGRVFGSWQEDTLENITGTVGIPYMLDYKMSGAFTVGADLSTGSNYAVATGKVADFDASLVARTSTETRARNIALLVCIKY